jgi:hypothetical protein
LIAIEETASKNESVISVTPHITQRSRPWNVTFAVEPVSRGDRQTARPAVLSSPTIHRYVLLILALALGITMLALYARPPNSPIGELICAIAFGWALGQLFRWEPPR